MSRQIQSYIDQSNTRAPGQTLHASGSMLKGQTHDQKSTADLEDWPGERLFFLKRTWQQNIGLPKS